MHITRREFRERLELGVLVADGAMGTLLSTQEISLPYELACITHPDKVSAAHRAYYEAGARLIETNTYCANRLKLLTTAERISDVSLLSTKEIGEWVLRVNRNAVRLARNAVGEDALVFGAIGPVGKPLEPMGPTRLEEAAKAFEEQIRALVEGGVDGFLLETFTDLLELKIACDIARRFAPDLPIIASKAFVEDGESLMEGLPEHFAREASQWDIDALGANCVVGPQRMLDITRSLALGAQLPILAMPTPGLPQRARGQVVYDIQPDYFGKYAVRLAEAGARIVGGCCGTTPDHICAISQQVASLKPSKLPHAVTNVRARTREEKPLPAAEPSRFSQKLGKERVITVELDLPRGLNMQKVFDGARLLKEHGVDLIDISDGARARLRMNVIAISHLIQEQTGIEVMMHFACRDRNLLAIQSDLLGAHALGIRNILAITGDPAQIGDYPSATSVFDVDSIGLTRILQRFNEGYDLASNSIGMRANFTIAVAYNPLAYDLPAEQDRLRRKVEEGAQVIYTQPIFEVKVAEETAAFVRSLNRPWLIGVLPLRNTRHTEFMHNEVPGISIPDAIRHRMANAPEEDALTTGIEIAQNFLRETTSLADGIYLMPPAGSAQIALRTLEGI